MIDTLIFTPTHRQLVLIGARWLNKKASNVFYRSRYVLTEFVCQGTREIPDILGLRPYGNVLIEVKTSRSDFKKDFLKDGRRRDVLQLGHRRFYLTPVGLVSPEELPDGWGLLESNGSDIALVKHSDKFEEDRKAINFIYHSILSRTVKPQVFDFRK